ncbi:MULTISPECIES: TetR/AcrR family transcriptional regulator [Bradyrhizobium]|jgi:AcrR family transcriptional regulator|uniref:AcrR family transcriptional regulator n=2 Tax=Bradyrhizobium ottawaense TaxID=931866 RepID=A0ABV4G7A4_9BRAD|nr:MULTISPECIES: TetR/AcrR family transcriptional regulator [Bradyrhizobium]MBR1293069.1 TetR/AcrR family transcriptional regulator [Bradyrhizobium ottawaense]MBR1324778.1 TetR/AcrR family transcriptional regulator [Bradyrhizobium ottawaense]MBR1336638.1 TetR/AcrR family transcriptional regulator [Bradyrhizobium ottawaense]MBR1365720.1 TetR/AcrR family transcriptional regulator [Bradyrhizobium ottawaense]MDA9414842.1 TetR family transcriptional regulator [Bradyrhizobium sp. CCBAU 25360]
MIEGKRAAAMAENRAKLIRAARKAFATQGYAEASMDELTASVGLTRGALYHNFEDKKGLLWAVVAQIDGEMAERLRAIREQAPTLWQGLLAEGSAYIEMALDPEIQRIMLLDGPAVLGDPSKWPGENACLDITMRTIRSLIDEKVVKPLDVEAAGRLLNGAALSAALWVAAANDPKVVLNKAVDAFRQLASGLLRDSNGRA